MVYENQDKIVTEDFRERIIVDANSPLLAMKANRDRYTNKGNQKEYTGKPYLGNWQSEDALTWNVFRSLQKAEKLPVITNELGIGSPRGLLLWTLAPELDEASTDLQYITGALIRKYDGRLAGQISEPDVIILGSSRLAVIECKLSKPGSAPSHLWEARSIDSVKKRRPIYAKGLPALFKFDVTDEEIISIYQLIRITFYAVKIAEYYKVNPVVVSLANKKNWSQTIHQFRKSANLLLSYGSIFANKYLEYLNCNVRRGPGKI